MKTVLSLGMIVGLLAATGCATTFTGDPHFEGGRPACEAKCAGVGMKAAGLVFVGEYSSACVCELPRLSGANNNLLGQAAATTAAAAGVKMQQDQQQQNQAAR